MAERPLVPRPRAVFPGSFDPVTVAHVAVADAVRAQLGVSTVDLVISRIALAKEHRRTTPAEHRAAAIERLRDARPWLRGLVTDAQLLADIAAGYDVLVIGADKWDQLLDVRFYGGSSHARDDALARLPRLAVAPRAGASLPSHDQAMVEEVHVLDVDGHHHEVSSTAVRGGRTDWRA